MKVMTLLFVITRIAVLIAIVAVLILAGKAIYKLLKKLIEKL